MITRVRIAPVEQWCKQARSESPSHFLAAGRIIEIKTDSMESGIHATGEPCRAWIVSDQSIEELSKEGIINFIPERGKFWVCEHILEMD